MEHKGELLNNGVPVNTGLTKREYFAAHAPVVPDWFKPSIPYPESRPFNQSKWDEYSMVVIIQWRYFYADRMLKTGEAK